VGAIIVLALLGGGIWWATSQGPPDPSPEETALLSLAQEQGFDASHVEPCEVTESSRGGVVAAVQCRQPSAASSDGHGWVILYKYSSFADLHASFANAPSDGDPAALPDGQIVVWEGVGGSSVSWTDQSTMTLSQLSSTDFTSAELYQWWLENVDDY